MQAFQYWIIATLSLINIWDYLINQILTTYVKKQW